MQLGAAWPAEPDDGDVNDRRWRAPRCQVTLSRACPGETADAGPVPAGGSKMPPRRLETLTSATVYTERLTAVPSGTGPIS
jgi:hypothetical protein